MSLAGAKILVTGADGFIGSHLVERLHAEGSHVRAFCFYNSNGSYGWLDTFQPALDGEVEMVLGDVRDRDGVSRAVKGTDVVLHLASLISIPFSYEAPQSFVETNVIGTFNVLQAARDHGVGRMVHTSTSEVYGTPETVPISEGHPLRAQSPYSATKIAADKLCEAWACSYQLPVVVLRPFNTFGPRQSLRAVIPTLLSQLLAKVSELRLGSLAPKRDFTFVSDTVDGLVRAASVPLTPGEVVHLGTGTAVSVAELVERAIAITGHRPTVVEEPARVRPPGSEVQVLLSDPSKAGALLGWAPRVTLEDGLRRTADWLGSRTNPAESTRYHR